VGIFTGVAICHPAPAKHNKAALQLAGQERGGLRKTQLADRLGISQPMRDRRSPAQVLRAGLFATPDVIEGAVALSRKSSALGTMWSRG
jgi:hypothetical protein